MANCDAEDAIRFGAECGVGRVCVGLRAGAGLLAQEAASPGAISTGVRGEVVDGAGKPVPGALVVLEGPGAAGTRQEVTGSSGEFLWDRMRAGQYTVRAEKAERRSESAAVSVEAGASPRVKLVLGAQTAAGRGRGADTQQVEFADGPNFVVAGVTDWTAVGGHGSDATLRTSEDLARETVGLKAEGAGRGEFKPESEASRREEERLKARLAAAPGSDAAERALGEFYLGLGRYGEALPLLTSVAGKDGKQGKAEDEYLLALACRGVGDAGEARRHVQQSLAQKETSGADRLLGELDEQAGDALSAVRYEERAAKLNPSEENYFVWGSELLLHRAGWQASQVFQRGAAQYPGSARMRIGLGAALFADALYEQASQQLCEAAGLDPADAQAYVLMGKVELAAPARLPCIEQKLTGYASAHPEDATADYLYAMSLKKQQGAADQAQVERLLEKVVALKPDDAEAYLQLGILSAGRRDVAGAIGYYAKAVQADPELAEAHYRLGVAYDRVGEPARAKAEFARHEALVKEQADAVEQQRRSVKQFSVASPGMASGAGETKR